MISESLDDRLDESRGLKLSRHLDDCSDCRRHQSVLARGQELLRESFVEPPENFDWKVQLKIQQALREKAGATEPVTGWSFWRPALVSASGVAVIVLALGSYVITRGPGATEPGMQAALPTVAAPTEFAVAEEQESDAEPDLSGAVRGQPLRINAASGGFGIRTVADEGFANSSPFTDPPTGWRQEGHGESIELRRLVTEDGRSYYIMHRRIGHRGGSLNLKLHRSTLLKPGESRGHHHEPDS
jgi:hypothetical protein